MEHVAALVKNGELLDFIAENTYQYYLEQNTEIGYPNSLTGELGTEKRTHSLLPASVC